MISLPFRRRKRLEPARWLAALACTSILLMGWTAALAQQQPEEEAPSSAMVLEIPALARTDGWIEVTPLTSTAEPIFVELEDRTASAVEVEVERLTLELPESLVLVCTGGRPFAVACESHYLLADEPSSARFAFGRRVSGIYRLDRLPVAGARVSVVPLWVAGRRPFTLPLSASERWVETDVEGAFLLPALAAGDYFLETVLPTGRVHRSDLFTVPELSSGDLSDGIGAEISGDLSAAAAAVEDSTVDLGIFDVDDGLTIELVVRDGAGEPLPGAIVGARQGSSPRDVVTFEAVTDDEGKARLSGFRVEEPLRTTCRRQGFTTVVQEFELLPVTAECQLEAVAAIVGLVLGPDGQPPAGTTVAVAASATGAAAWLPAEVAADGSFVKGDLAAGDYRWLAVAPGFAAESGELGLAAGEERDLATVRLLAGRQVSGTVRDAVSRQPIANVDIAAVSPPGAVAATTDADGEFSFAVGGTEPLELRFTPPSPLGEPPLAAVVDDSSGQAAIYDYAPRNLRLATVPFDDPVDVELERGGRLRIEAFDEVTGAPCQGCLFVLRPGAARWLTDERGEALSASLAAGWYEVYRPALTHLGSLVAERPDAERRRVRVVAGKTVSLRFGEPHETIRVTLDGAPANAQLSVRAGGRRQDAIVEEDGTYRVHRRPGQPLDLFVQFWDRSSQGLVEVRQMILSGDSPPTLKLTLPGSEVRGRALEGLTAIAGLEVQLFTFAEGAFVARSHTRPDGHFTLPYLPPGVYGLRLGKLPASFVSVTEGRDVDLGTFELRPEGY